MSQVSYPNAKRLKPCAWRLVTLTVFDIGLIKAVDIVAFNDLRRLPRSIEVKQRIAHIATLGVDVVKLHTHTVVASEFDYWRCVIVGFQTSAQRPHRLVENACRRVGGISQRCRQHKHLSFNACTDNLFH